MKEPTKRPCWKSYTEPFPKLISLTIGGRVVDMTESWCELDKDHPGPCGPRLMPPRRCWRPVFPDSACALALDHEGDCAEWPGVTRFRQLPRGAT